MTFDTEDTSQTRLAFRPPGLPTASEFWSIISTEGGKIK